MTPFHMPYSMRWNRSSLQYSSIKFTTTCCRSQCCTQELCMYKSWTRDSHNTEVPHLSVSNWTTYWLYNFTTTLKPRGRCIRHSFSKNILPSRQALMPNFSAYLDVYEHFNFCFSSCVFCQMTDNRHKIYP